MNKTKRQKPCRKLKTKQEEQTKQKKHSNKRNSQCKTRH